MEIRSVQYQECTAGKSVQCREGTAGTSGETKFSGVHKDSCAARGLGARALASPSPIVLKNLVQSGAPASQLARFSLAKISNGVKFKINSTLPN